MNLAIIFMSLKNLNFPVSVHIGQHFSHRYRLQSHFHLQSASSICAAIPVKGQISPMGILGSFCFSFEEPAVSHSDSRGDGLFEHFHILL